MSHDHQHHGRNVNKRQLLIAIIISFAMMIIELAGGMWTNSLALISDAFHMFTHIFALAVSLIAVRLTERPPTGSSTFGYHRAETIAAAINGFFLVAVTGVILYEAAHRLMDEAPVAEFEMLIIASAGLAVNLATAVILMKADRHNLNIRGAFLHMVGDAASSVGIIAAGIVIYYTGWYYLDPAVSGIIAVVILYWAYGLLRDSLRVLMQSAPPDIDIPELESVLSAEFNAVRGIHDVHLWELSQNKYIFSAHIITEDLRISEAEKLGSDMAGFLQERFRISHTNFQFETESAAVCACDFHHLS